MSKTLDDGGPHETREFAGIVFTKNGAMWTPEGHDTGFHVVEDRGDILIGKLNKHYILDDTGAIISTGHHEITGTGPFRVTIGSREMTLTEEGGVWIPESPEVCDELSRSQSRTLPRSVRDALRTRADQR